MGFVGKIVLTLIAVVLINLKHALFYGRGRDVLTIENFVACFVGLGVVLIFPIEDYLQAKNSKYILILIAFGLYVLSIIVVRLFRPLVRCSKCKTLVNTKRSEKYKCHVCGKLHEFKDIEIKSL